MNCKNYTVSALDLIGLEIFKADITPEQRSQMVATLSLFQYLQRYPFSKSKIDEQRHPAIFLANGLVLYRDQEDGHGGYIVTLSEGTVLHYHPLVAYTSEDVENCPTCNVVGFTSLPGYDDPDRSMINLCYVPEERAQEILAAHPEVQAHPRPVHPPVESADSKFRFWRALQNIFGPKAARKIVKT